MVIIPGEETMRSPRHLFPSRHQGLHTAACCRSILLFTVYLLFRCTNCIVILCCSAREDDKLHIELVKGWTVHVPLVAWCLKPYAIVIGHLEITFLFDALVKKNIIVIVYLHSWL